MMNRRSFLSKAWWMPVAIPAAMMREGLTPSGNDNYQFEYKGYRIRWTDWKGSQQHDLLVGQWLAVTIKEPYQRIYSSVPGACGFYSPGYTFDVSVKRSRKNGAFARGALLGCDWDQVLLTTKTPQSVKDDEQAQGLKRLCNFIDESKEG